jgi:hypothetical protein
MRNTLYLYRFLVAVGVRVALNPVV